MHVFLLGFTEQGSVAGMLIRKWLIPSHGIHSLNAASRLATTLRYLHGFVLALSGRKPNLGIAAQQDQSKDWNLGWSPKLCPLLVSCRLPWWKQEVPVPIPPRRCLWVAAGRYQWWLCSNTLICKLKILPACKCLVSGLSPAPVPLPDLSMVHTPLWDWIFHGSFASKLLGNVLHMCLDIYMYVYTPSHIWLARPHFPRSVFALNSTRFFWCFMCATSDFRGMQHLGQSCKSSLPGAGEPLGALAVTCVTASRLDSETEPWLRSFASY